MILQDIGEQVAAADCPADRRAFLQALGQLHGCSRCLLDSGQLHQGPLKCFPASHAYTHYDEWEGLLTQGLDLDEYDLPASTLEACRRLRDALAAEPRALLHGDTDLSNAIVTNSGIGLIDWERACLGPASVDLSRVVPASELADDAQTYRTAFNETAGFELSNGDVLRVVGIGILFDSLRWICHYIKQSTCGNSPDEEWRSQYYIPCLEHIRSEVWLAD